MDPELAFFGIGKFSLDLEPLGGRIKEYPEDFVVEEISDSGILASKVPRKNEGGSYLLCLAFRRNMTHSNMIRYFETFFKVKADDIGTAGIKDKRACVKQLVSVFNPRNNINFKTIRLNERLEITNLGWRKKGMVRGHLGGNRFSIIIRDAKTLTDDDLIHVKKFFESKKILNFYGPQRFGCTRPINHLVGRAIFENDYEKAVRLFIGEPSVGDPQPNDKFRNLFRNTMEPELVLKEWIGIRSEERNILKWLKDRPNDYEGAFTRLPIHLRSLLKRSFLSYLWNLYLSRRPIDEKLKGERAILIQGKKNIEVALPSKKWPKPLNEVWKSIFSDLKLDIALFKNEKHTTRVTFQDLRDFKISRTEKGNIRTEFNLGAGQYATITLRELMQSKIDNYC